MIRPASLTGEERIVKIEAGSISLEGNLIIPKNVAGMVIFVHESGSNRYNPINRYIAKYMRKARIGALLFDLMDPQEAEIDKITRHMRFDIDLMVNRVEGVTKWVLQQPNLRGLPIGYFGCGRGAATALITASQYSEVIRAVVSHGGRLDLAETALGEVQAPTLLIVGKIKSLLTITKTAFQILPPKLEKKIEIFRDVSYFWDDPDTLKRLSVLTKAWFEQYLGHGEEGEISQHSSGLMTV